LSWMDKAENKQTNLGFNEVVFVYPEVFQEIVELLGQSHFRVKEVQPDGGHHDGAGIEQRVVRFP